MRWSSPLGCGVWGSVWCWHTSFVGTSGSPSRDPEIPKQGSGAELEEMVTGIAEREASEGACRCSHWDDDCRANVGVSSSFSEPGALASSIWSGSNLGGVCGHSLSLAQPARSTCSRHVTFVSYRRRVFRRR